MSSDPILRRFYQPAVDALGLVPAKAAAVAADAFLASAIAMTLYRILSPGDVAFGWRVMHMAGAVVVHCWMRWCAANGGISLHGPLGLMHAAMRTGLLGLAVVDAVSLRHALSHPSVHSDGASMRALIQLAEDVLGASALYLSACSTPPPRNRRRLARA